MNLTVRTSAFVLAILIVTAVLTVAPAGANSNSRQFYGLLYDSCMAKRMRTRPEDIAKQQCACEISYIATHMSVRYGQNLMAARGSDEDREESYRLGRGAIRACGSR